MLVRRVILSGVLAGVVGLVGCGGGQESRTSDTKVKNNTNISAPRGWSSEIQGKSQVFTRRYRQGKMTISVSSWQGARGRSAQRWLKRNQRRTSGTEQVISTSHQVNKSRFDNASFVLRQIKAKGGKPRSSLLLACVRGGYVRTVDAFGPKSLFGGSNKAVLKDAMALSKIACSEQQASTASAQVEKAKVKAKKAKALRRTKPNKGIKPSKVEAIMVDDQIDVMMGGIEVRLHLLLKDGWVYKMGSGGAEIPPSDFDVKYSRKFEPDRWYKWKKVGKNKYKKKTKHGWESIGGDKCNKGKKNETISGNYGQHAGSQMFGSSSSYVNLHKNGKFSLSSNSLMSSSPLSPISSIGVFSSDKDGSRSTVSSSGENVVTSRRSKKKDGSKNSGTYKINGYLIEMRHDNGWVRRELFCFTNSTKTSIIIDDEYYWISKK